MKELYRFENEVSKGYQGNISYVCQLPENTNSLHVKLSYNKDRIHNIYSYVNEYHDELATVYENYLNHTPTNNELETFVNNMKTEIQLCLFMDNEFVGNIHKPGKVKEIQISKEHVSNGCIEVNEFKRNIKIVVNVFQVIEEGTKYTLTVESE